MLKLVGRCACNYSIREVHVHRMWAPMIGGMFYDRQNRMVCLLGAHLTPIRLVDKRAIGSPADTAGNER